MSFEPYIILSVLLITMALFIWGRWRYDVVALIALMVSVAAGAVPFDKVYSGLSNSAVITVACVMIISRAIYNSGILDQLVRHLGSFTKSRTLHVGVLSFITAVLSAFMNNVGALALMMPVAIQTARDTKRSPSLLLMPIALGSALGGLTTVIGTPPNLLISAYRQEYTGQSFSMFDYSYVGVGVAIVGLLFIALLGWRLMPKKTKSSTSVEDLFEVQDYITEIRIPKNSPVIGKKIKELEALSQDDYFIVGIIRKEKKKLVVRSNQLLQEEDILIVEASAKALQKLIDLAKLELVADKKLPKDLLKGDDISLVEAVVPQGSRLENRSSSTLSLRSRYFINLLAIARQGKPFKERLHQVKIQPGDVLLLQGPTESTALSISRLGLFPLVARGVHVGRRPKAYIPLIIFAIAITLAALRLLPVQVAFGGAVLLMVLFNAIPLRNIYENIDWPIIVLLAAMIPIGNALQSTGGTGLISHYFIALSGHVSPLVILILLLVVTMTLSDFMNNAATAVVMAPIAVSIAQALKVDIDPFLMAVSIGASCSFLTPVGHQNNTLVMGPGGYKFSDYIRIGLPLEILIVIVSVPLLIWAWPLH